MDSARTTFLLQILLLPPPFCCPLQGRPFFFVSCPCLSPLPRKGRQETPPPHATKYISHSMYPRPMRGGSGCSSATVSPAKHETEVAPSRPASRP